jgi:hypothetical protein
MYLKYSYLACGPRVKCGSCGNTEWSQVKQSQDEGIGWVPYSWRRTEPIPASWSLHCGGPCSKKTLTTTVFEKLENPLFRNLTEKTETVMSTIVRKWRVNYWRDGQRQKNGYAQTVWSMCLRARSKSTPSYGLGWSVRTLTCLAARMHPRLTHSKRLTRSI